MKNKIITISVLLIFIGCRTSNVTFIIKVPDKTDQVTITGNLPQLGNWNPITVPLQKIDEGSFAVTLKLPNNKDIEYKITRGSWTTEALSSDSQIPNNYEVIVTKDTIIIHQVQKWKDDNFPISIVTGKVEYHRNFYSPQLKNQRDIIVWLPPSYNINDEKRYPTLYLHDGQNVFDPATSYIGNDWQLDETVSKLIEDGKMNEIIMIGIYCNDDRRAEYSPKQKGKKYSKFLIENVKPFIDFKYRTKSDASNTAVMGSSMGGIISFHLAWEYPEIFSMAGCLSPAFLVDNNEIVERLRNSQKSNSSKIIILNGTVGLESELQPAISEMINVLKVKNHTDLIYNIFEGAEHNEAAWATQVEIPLLYFFGINYNNVAPIAGASGPN